ncbi:hypothetical protein [uncultured Jatrophihabitans sp.]|uniref:hypothetical protein n=1 Tax=uncultured Jatrophihabitans sp. TaxID=1610747 RepID=UPI0035C9D1A6
MQDVLVRQDALEALVRCIADIGPPNWIQTYAAFEYKSADGEPSFTWLLVGVVNHGVTWGFGQFDQDPQVYDLAMAYHDMFDDQGWTSLELKVDYDGEFHAEHGYGPVPPDTFDPALMNRLQHYGETWTREHGPAPHQGAR